MSQLTAARNRLNETATTEAPAPPEGGLRSHVRPWFQFAVIVAELLLLTTVAMRFNIESRAFGNLLSLLTGAVIAHHLLPIRWQLGFFVVLSCASVALVLGLRPPPLGWDPVAGLSRMAVLVAVTAGIVSICRLRLGLWAKAGLVAAAGVVLAGLRAGWVAPPYLAAIWPIIAAMFMFRVIVYLYDFEHEREKPGFLRSMAYFLMLPNVCFTLFPVVDYKTFYKTYYNDEAAAIYQKGLNWMIRGIIHLVLYRVVYFHIYVSPTHVLDGADVARCLVSNLLIYLRVSGQFHLIIGMLHLFGFNLPETNRRYLLASSFTDYWRRVNIYWKDFVLKVFYTPAYFRLKGRGPTTALVVATLFCFVLTWALHSYQWFWILGKFPITTQDVIFWGTFGLLVLANSLWEARRGRARTLGTRSQTWPQRLGLGARTAATFAMLAVLWSIWSAESMTVWRQMWAEADLSTLGWGVVVLAVVAGLAMSMEAWDAMMGRILGATRLRPQGQVLRQAAVLCVLPGMLMYLSTVPRVRAMFGDRGEAFLATLDTNRPNRYDEDLMEKGYYENLMDVERANPALGELYNQRPADWKGLHETDALIPVNDFRLKELAPSRTTKLSTWTATTNRWGMRDREYEYEKPPGTFRIALLGASTALGAGVNDDETFENLLEDRLNREPPSQAPLRRFEILNFGVNGYSALDDLVALENKALAFRPNAVMLLANPTDPYWVKQRLAKVLRSGIELPYPHLKQVAEKARVTAETTDAAAMWRLRPYEMELAAWGYEQIAKRCQAEGIATVWFLLPRPRGDDAKKEQIEGLFKSARQAGYGIIDLRKVYDGHPTQSLIVAPWDLHPNALGHRLIADALYRDLCGEVGSRMFADSKTAKPDNGNETTTRPANTQGE